jgi:alanine-glyoxylate transaminase/serine-glyoxylate transaminase/serine-pyruvate transaminase
VEEARVRRQLLEELNIEIGGGLGSLKGKIWRIGLMGYNATSRNAQKVVEALRGCLEQTPAAA